MDWQPNTINVRWYSDDTQLSVPTNAQTCSYDGDLYLPSAPTKKGYTFEGWELKHAIPEEYTELQYIESTGTQYIDTGIAPTNNTGFIIDLQYTNSEPVEEIAIGALNPNFLIDRISSLRFSYAYRNGYGVDEVFDVSSETIVSRNTFELNWKNSGVFRYGNIISNLNSVVFSNPNPIYIFTGNRDGYTYKNIRGRVFNVKISNNSDMVRNFIPAKRNSDNALGMYDTVSGNFFTNSGSGTFTAGPVVQ